jgi:energy-coupling factor transporter ATP-binding protein EcfA2
MSSFQNDTISKADYLNRKKYAKQIFKTLQHSFPDLEESFVVGISGRWGSGKSTLLEFIISAIEEGYSKTPDLCKIIRINAWKNSTYQEMERELLEKILQKFEEGSLKSKTKNLLNDIRGYLKYLNVLRFAKHIHPTARQLFDSLDDYLKKVNIKNADELKVKINTVITELGLRLFIFIDDLDKLDTNEVLNVFKILKLNANFHNTIYFLAYDRDVVTAIVDKTYPENGSRYLEKIITVDFPVPNLLDYQLENLFFEQVMPIVKSEIDEYSEKKLFSIWNYYGLKEFIHNLRDIKRFCNSLLLSFPLIHGEVNEDDFICLEAIKVFDHSTYERLFFFVQFNQRLSIGESVPIEQKILAEFAHTKSSGVIGYLFQSSGAQPGINKKRLKDMAYFHRYFSLDIPKNDVSEKDLRLFLEPKSNTKAVLREINNEGRILNLLRRLSDIRLSEAYQLSDVRLLKSFLDFWDERHNDINSAIEEHIWNSYFNLSHSIKDTFEAAKCSIENLSLQEKIFAPARFVFNHFLINLEEDAKIYGSIKDQLEIHKEELTVYFISYLREFWHSYMNTTNNENRSFTNFLFIYSYAKFLPDDYMIKLKEKLESNSFVLFLLKHCIASVEAGTNRILRINPEYQSLLLPGDELTTFHQKLKTFKKGVASDNDLKLIESFLLQIN